MKYYDYSIHFTLKNQSIERIMELFYSYFKNNDIINLNNTYTDINDSIIVLHHCFLPKYQNFKVHDDKENVYKFIDDLNENQIAWNVDYTKKYNENLRDMLEHIKIVEGCSIFIGDITNSSVYNEYIYAKKNKLNIIRIK